MSTSVLVALKQAIRAALLADAGFLAALGGEYVYDEVPRAAAPPYLVFGEGVARDLSTSSGAAAETLLALTLWSRQGGSREALALAARAEALLQDAALTLEGHRLVSLAVPATETRRPNDREAWRVTLRLRAYTEAL